MKNGETITVEFFKIRGGGAVHENITKQAAKEAKEAKEASIKILKLFKENVHVDDLEKYLRNTVYKFSEGVANKKAGGTLEKFKKEK